MKILFIGVDKFWAEGIRSMLEDMFTKTVTLDFVQKNGDYKIQIAMTYENYDFIFIDAMSYDFFIYRMLSLTVNSSRGKIVFVISQESKEINIHHRNLMSRAIMVYRNISIEELKFALISPFSFESNNIFPHDYCHSNFKKRNVIKNAFELEVIRSISAGEKVKDFARRKNKSDKAIYQLLSRIKLRMGIKNKNEFLLFLSKFTFVK